MSPPMTAHAWLRYDVIRRHMPADVHRVLEIGAGQGSVGSLLARGQVYVGLEPDPTSFAQAQARIGTTGTIHNIREEDFVGEPFDLVCAFEVLEHIDQDVQALRRWRRHLRDGGWLFVSVPSGPDRFGPTDVRQGHYRRYERDGLARAVRAAGYTDAKVISYGFPLGNALLAASNFQSRRKPRAPTLEERTAASGRWMQPSRGMLRRLVAVPSAYLQRPFARTDLGTGLVAIAQKGECADTDLGSS